MNIFSLLYVQSSSGADFLSVDRNAGNPLWSISSVLVKFPKSAVEDIVSVHNFPWRCLRHLVEYLNFSLWLMTAAS